MGLFIARFVLLIFQIQQRASVIDFPNTTESYELHCQGSCWSFSKWNIDLQALLPACALCMYKHLLERCLLLSRSHLLIFLLYLKHADRNNLVLSWIRLHRFQDLRQLCMCEPLSCTPVSPPSFIPCDSKLLQTRKPRGTCAQLNAAAAVYAPHRVICAPPFPKTCKERRTRAEMAAAALVVKNDHVLAMSASGTQRRARRTNAQHLVASLPLACQGTPLSTIPSVTEVSSGSTGSSVGKIDVHKRRRICAEMVAAIDGDVAIVTPEMTNCRRMRTHNELVVQYQVVGLRLLLSLNWEQRHPAICLCPAQYSHL